MSLLRIGEIFGNDTSVPLDPEKRKQPFCRFCDGPCTKQGKLSPLGICSFTDGTRATITCPTRFRDGNQVFHDAARLAFGAGQKFIAVPEIRLLEVSGAQGKRKIGKVDFLLATIENAQVTDFAALEIQSVYISGHTIRPAFGDYLKNGTLSDKAFRRPDFRSSAQKRLMPQLGLKVPIFRRWGKRFFVAVDASFFQTLPKMRTQSAGNAEVTWLVYSFNHSPAGGYQMGDPTVQHTLWEDVLDSLREGRPPERHELQEELSKQIPKRQMFST